MFWPRGPRVPLPLQILLTAGALFALLTSR